LKAFIDSLGGLWFRSKLNGKAAGSDKLYRFAAQSIKFENDQLFSKYVV
jgi:hypothetical protein